VEYPKISTLYKRNPETFKVIPGSFTHLRFGKVKEYIFTEKIDGRCHRVILHPTGQIEHRGRTDKSTLAEFELDGAKSAVSNVLLRSVFNRPAGGEFPEVILYGELYGPKIQGGARYSDRINLRLFDAKVAGDWLDWEELEELAVNLEVPTVPVISYSSQLIPKTHEDMLIICMGSEVAMFEAGKGDVPAEGIVARTSPTQYLGDGERLMWKLKLKDFA